jgi:hypothetical protein
MFPSPNSPHVAETLWSEAGSWEAMSQPSVPSVSLRADSPAAAPSWRKAAGRALGLARAFLTLEDGPVDAASAAIAEPSARPHGPVESPAHPHRQPLRPVHRSRRPGAAAPRPQLCITPLLPPRTPKHAAR